MSFIWRKVEDIDHQLEFKMIMSNANECINLIIKQLKKLGLIVAKGYEKKRKIMESEVTENAIKEMNIKELTEKIEEQEKLMAQHPSPDIVNNLIPLYNKAIEYYSALNNEKHIEFLQKLQRLFIDDRI